MKKYKGMRERLFISVVVPTCNRAISLIRCIESIRANNYQYYEIIIVDQSSGDGTQRLIKEKFNGDARVIYLHSEIKCSSNARNEGWHAAKGEVIAFTDDDATVDGRWLEAFASIFNEQETHIGMAGGRVIPIFEVQRPSWLPPERDYLLPSFDAGNEVITFPAESLPMSVNFALRREVLRQTGGFDTRLGLKSDSSNPYIGGEDSFLAKKVKEAGYSIIYQPLAVVYHPVTSERLTRFFFLKRNFREGVTAIALEDIMTPSSKEKLTSHAAWHSKRFMLYLLFFAKDFLMPTRQRAKKYMLRAAELAFSAGVIREALYLRKSKKGEETDACRR